MSPGTVAGWGCELSLEGGEGRIKDLRTKVGRQARGPEDIWKERESSGVTIRIRSRDGKSVISPHPDGRHPHLGVVHAGP